MSRRMVNVGLTACAAAVIVAVVVSSWRAPATTENSSPMKAPPTDPSPNVVTTPSQGIGSPDERLYAVSVPELSGLPPDAPPGTALELWVAWDPPLTKRPKIQLLIPRVTVERIVPGLTPEAPATVMLEVPRRAMPDMLYGDRYGTLSVTVLP